MKEKSIMRIIVFSILGLSVFFGEKLTFSKGIMTAGLSFLVVEGKYGNI